MSKHEYPQQDDGADEFRAPLSSAQRSIWFAHALNPDGSAYNVSLAWRVIGDIRLDALTDALADVIDRHEVLRTRFVQDGSGDMLQVVSQYIDLAVPVTPIDEASLAAAAADFGNAPFDLARGAIRATLLQLSSTDQVFVLALHHIACDGWSLSLLVDDLSVAYSRRLRSADPDWPDPEIQFADYASWEASREPDEESVAFWVESLRDCRDLELPLDRPRPSVQGATGASIPVWLDETLTRSLRELSAQESTTLFVALRSAFAAILASCGGQDQFAVGSPFSNRLRTETRQVMGPFIAMLPLPADVSGDPTLRQLVSRTQAAVSAAWEHAEVSFEQIVRATRIQRDLSRHALFQVSFALQNVPTAQLALEGLEVQTFGQPKRSSMFDLSLYLFEAGEGLAGAVEYSTDLFDRETVERMMSRFVSVCQSMARDLDTRLSSIPFGTDDPVAAGLCAVGGGDAVSGGGGFVSVVERWRGVVCGDGGGAGLVAEGGWVSFGELGRRVDVVAGVLAGLGAGRGCRVGVVGGRDGGMVVAVWAVWQCGASFVAVDPGWPAARVAAVLGDAGVGVVVGCGGVVPAGVVPAVVLDEGGRLVAARGAAGGRGAAGAGPGAGDEAYVLFTSGSTGRPRGVVVGHGAVAALADGLAGVVPPAGPGAPRLRVAVNAGLAFDACVQQLVQWAAGHCLVPVPGAVRRDPGRLVRFVRELAVDVLDGTPSQVRELAAAGLLDGPGAPRLLLVGGEAVDAGLWRLLAGSGVAAVNMYGLAECGVDSTAAPVRPGTAPGIGLPLPGVRAYVLDRAGRPAGTDVTGRLWLAGPGLGHGYLADPALTADRYRPDPFAARSGERMFDTGDLARRRPDGSLDYLGRADRQIKILGQRLEPGEIEAILLTHPAVAAAAVTTRPGPPGHPHLIAYAAIPNPSHTSATELEDELRQRCREQLPAAAVPARVIIARRLPQTPNGKVDFAALFRLVDRELTPEEAARDDEPPQDGYQALLLNIWREVLPPQRIDVHDNFFTLGGDSILGLHVIARAVRKGLPLKVSDLFEYPTIAGLAKAARHGAGSLAPAEAPDQAPLLPAQAWLAEQRLAIPNYWTMTRTLVVRAAFRPDDVRRAVAEVVARHVALNSRVDLGNLTAGWTSSPDGSAFGMEVVQGTGRAADETVGAAIASAQLSLDLARGPVARAVLAEDGSDEHRLTLIIHHAVMDAVSWQVLVADLADVLAPRPGAGPTAPGTYRNLPTSPLALAMAAASRTWTNEEAQWWLDHMPTEAAAIPLDDEDVTDVEAGEQYVALILDNERTTHVLRRGGAMRARPYELLFSALVTALARWTGRQDAFVELEGHGREELGTGLDLSRSVGWFTSIYPVWLARVDPDPLVLLRDVKDLLRSVPDHGAGFGWMRYHSDHGRLLARTPRREVVFNYLGAAAEADPAAAVRLDPSVPPEERGPQNVRPYRLSVEAEITDRRIRALFYFGRGHRESTIRWLVAEFDRAIEEITDMEPPISRALSVTDFPLANLRPADLETILAAYPDLDDVYNLTPAQEGLLFHTQLEPWRGLYAEQRVWTFSGPLEAELVEQAWRDVLGANPILRTAFVWRRVRQPVQVVLPAVAFGCETHDLSGLDAQAAGHDFERLLGEDRLREFDLSRAPTMRVTLVRLPEQRWAMIWTGHHLLLDGWSNGIVVDQIFSSLAARLRGEEPELRPTRPFRHFVEWYARRDRAGEQEHWTDYLADVTEMTALPYRRPLGVKEARYTEITLPLPDGLLQRLQRFGQENGLTVNTIALGAWALLLSRISGEQDVVLGAVNAGRPAELTGVEDIVGLCVNTLPVRVKVDENQSTLSYLHGIQGSQARGRNWEQSSLVDVQGWSEIKRGTPLFDTLFVFENYPVRQEGIDGLPRAGVTLVAEDVSSPVAYKLRCCFIPIGRPRVMFGYSTDALDGDDVHHLIRQFVAVLEQIADRQAEVLGNRTTVVPGVDPDPSEPLPACDHPKIPEMVQEWSIKTPAAPALEHAGHATSYAELWDLIAGLRATLRESGVAPGQPVAVTGARSVGLVAAMAAILAEGCVLMPVDPWLPAKLQREAAAMCGLLIDVGQSDDPGLGPPAVRVRADGSVISTARSVQVPAFGDDAAYVMFTSGSTGEPRAVLGRHRGLSHFLEWQRDTFSVGPADRSLQLTRLSFDVVMRDVFLPLVSGGCLVLPRRNDAMDAAAVWSALRGEGITLLHAVPTLAKSWLRDRPARLPADGSPRLRVTFFAGEPLQAGLVDAWRAATGEDQQVVNLYGPTETTLAVTHYVVPADSEPGILPLGRPISGVQVLVANRHGLAGIGEPGELIVRSPYRTHGYIGARTGFEPNTFAAEPAEDDLVYRTGDLGRRRRDGIIETLGRKDHQVKVRGVRVDLENVSRVATTHPDVSSCVVIMRSRTGQQDPQLVAYLVGNSGAQVNEVSVRDLMRRTLPPAAVPDHFVVLDAMPMLPSGKADKSRLPPPVIERPVALGELVEPRDSVEAAVRGLYAEVLDIEQVGVTDDFFDLGGHSLAATRLAGRLPEMLGVEVPLRVLFECPTVESLVAWARAEVPEPDEAASPVSPEELQERLRQLRELPADVRDDLLDRW